MSTAVAKTGIPKSKTLDQYAKAINAAHSKGVELIFVIGRNLRLAHDELSNHGDGTFGVWVKECCGFTDRTARRYLSVVDAFGDGVSDTVSEMISANALYYLSSDTTPEDAITDAIKAAEAGERVTLSKAKDIVAEYTVDAESSPAGDDEPEEWELFPAIKKFNRYVLKVYRHWPKDDAAALVGKLRSVADEIEAGKFQGGEFVDDVD